MRRSRRQRLGNGNQSDGQQRPYHSPDRHSWGGWCEIESEPAFFNRMLKQMGVQGIKVREIISLDQDVLQSLPRPIYGLIFLFKWKEDEDSYSEPDIGSDSSVWFANQTVDNACATVALLNILNNIPNVDLGVNLTQFKDFTRNLTPSLRGNTLGNFEFVRRIHNSFARKMDILNSDLQMRNEVLETSRKERKRKLRDEDTNFHFNAFVPINNTVFKLDGLESSPKVLAHAHIEGNEWIDQVKPYLEKRMATYGDFMEFAILGLVRDPLLDLRNSLIENVKSVLEVKQRLCQLDQAWQNLISDEPGNEVTADGFPTTTILGPNASFGLTQEQINEASLPASTLEKLRCESVEVVLALRKVLIESQKELRLSIKNEERTDMIESGRAETRCHDYGPAVEAWLRAHARKGAVQPLKSSIDDLVAQSESR